MSRAPGPSVLLRLRCVQLRRTFPPYGIVLWASALTVATGLIHRAVLQDPANGPYIAGGAVLLVWSLHQRRMDHHFLLRHLQHPRASMAVEYGALLLPVALGLAFAKAWLAIALVLPAMLVAWVPLVQGSSVRARAFRSMIPAELFEWKSVLQSTHPLGLLLWLAAIASCWLPVLPLFLVGAMAMLVAGAQEQCEPRAMLLATAKDARGLLRMKVFGSMRILLIMVLPVIIGATIFRPEWWWIHALFGVGMLVLVAYAIVLKYANYRPNIRLDANGANVAVAAVFAILPGLSLVPLIMLLTEWPKALANLNAYFHAHHR